jgi:kinetochore protein NDC80
MIQAVKDPRPLRDRQYQSKMRQDILGYLQNQLGLEITMSTLTNIQGKDYRAIFNELLLHLDPNHILNQPRFEDEFVPALKAVRYPFAHQIDNKWLAAPASMHSWPSLLGVLHWLVEMCKVCEPRSRPQHTLF